MGNYNNYERGQNRGQVVVTSATLKRSGSKNKKSCGCSNCSTLFMFLLVITALLLCMANFWITLHRYEQVKETLRHTQQAANSSYVDLMNQLNEKTASIKARHESDIAIVDEVIKRSTASNYELASKSKEQDMIRETRESFSLALSQLNSKLERVDNGNQINSQVLDAVKASVEKIEGSLLQNVEDVEGLHAKVDHMLAEALASISQQNYTGAETGAVFIALNKEIGRRQQLEKSVENLEKAANEEQRKRVNIMDELIRAEQASIHRLEETERHMRNMEEIHQEIRANFERQLLNQSNSLDDLLQQQVTKLNFSLHMKMEGMINEWNADASTKLDGLQSTLKWDRENALMRIQKNWEERMENATAVTVKEVAFLKNEVIQLRGRVDHFVQSLMIVLRLPSLVKALEMRMEALEAAEHAFGQ